MEKIVSVQYKVKIEKDFCKGCQLCVEFCPKKCLNMSSQLNKRGVKFAQKLEDVQCVNCGFCFLICPEACIEILK